MSSTWPTYEKSRSCVRESALSFCSSSLAAVLSFEVDERVGSGRLSGDAPEVEELLGEARGDDRRRVRFHVSGRDDARAADPRNVHESARRNGGTRRVVRGRAEDLRGHAERR
jgi:hypothetical protein